MKPQTIAVTLLLIGLVMGLPRKWFVIPFILVACIIPSDQRVIIFNLDFTPIRFCILFGMIRLWLRNETRDIYWNKFDKLVIVWAFSGAIVYILQRGQFSAVIYKSGVLYDCLGLYWVFRQALLSWKEIVGVFKMIAILAIISVPLLIYERAMEFNPFTYFGVARSGFHHDRYRCAGPFTHFILMGLFWANTIPLFIACIRLNYRRGLFIAGTVSAIICVILSASSTPVMALITVFGFYSFYRYRTYGKQIAWAMLLGVVALHMVMKKPVWHLMARVNVFGGSTGYHRYYLFDQFVNRISEWFVLGTPRTAHWGRGLFDITNHYVLEAVRGGAITLLLFLILLFMAVRNTLVCSNHKFKYGIEQLYWGVCVSVLGHCVSFFGVSYFGQIMILLYLTFSIVGYVTDQYESFEKTNLGSPRLLSHTNVLH